MATEKPSELPKISTDHVRVVFECTACGAVERRPLRGLHVGALTSFYSRHVSCARNAEAKKETEK